MKIRHLLKSQANEAFEVISHAGLEPSEFEWIDTENPQRDLVSQLIHKPSGYYFTFDNLTGFISRWSPSEQKLFGSIKDGNWKSQLASFRLWINYLKRETESPDLWAAISDEARILDSAASTDTTNAAFDSHEKEYILQGVNEIKQFLLTAHKLDSELVESRLNYLIESSERLGRKDWLNLLVSVLVTIVISAALPPEAARELFRFAGTVLRQIIDQPLLLM